MSPASPVSVHVEVLGDEVVERTLYFIGDRAVDLRPAWVEISGYMQDVAREQFQSQGARSGHPWEPLSNKYMFWKWNHGQRLEILRAGDKMYDELTGAGNSENASSFHDTYMSFGSNTPEFIFQQGNTGTGNVPVRRPLVLTDADVRTISGMIMDRIISGVGFKQDFSRSSSGRTYYSKRGAGGRFSR